MSDLIDFDAPASASINNEAGPQFADFCTVENNPFDSIFKKVIDYEKDLDDPFELKNIPVKSKDDYIRKHRRYSDLLKMNKTMDETESNLNISVEQGKDELVQGDNDISIITDLNDTNLISDNIDGREIIDTWKSVPCVNISPAPCNNADLSILNETDMNDSLLNLNNNPKNVNIGLGVRLRSMSQTDFLSPKRISPLKKCRRFLSVNDSSKNCIFEDNNTLLSVKSSEFEDPFNNAFKKISMSDASVSCNSLNNNFNLSTNKQKLERLNSDSSVFSTLSNISTIPIDPVNKIRQERFWSEGSTFSGISNLSIIPNMTDNSSSYDSHISNDTMNKGFVTSKLELSTANSTKPQTPFRPDLIKKFYEIKSRMSSSRLELPKNENQKDGIEKNTSNSNVLEVKNNLQNSEEKLIDVDTSNNSVFNDKVEMNNIIVHEAKKLAKSFEKMSSTKGSTSNNEEDLFFSKIQLNFDDLPPSDDENVSNLIDLSPAKESEIKESSIEKNTSQKDNLKTVEKNLESEFVESKDFNKTTQAVVVLSDLEKLLGNEKEKNPQVCKILHDLQELLGVEYHNNTEILQACLQNSNDFKKENVSEKELNTSKNISDHDSKSVDSNENVKNDSDLNQKSTAIKNTEEKESQNTEQKETKNSTSESSEDQKLAVNLLHSLNKIKEKNNEDIVVDILRTILNMTSKLQTENKNKQSTELTVNEKNVTPRLNRSASTLYRSPSRKTPMKLQNKSFEVLPLHRSPSLNLNSDKSLEIPKDKRRSHLISMKRTSTDPGNMSSTVNKMKNKSPKKEEQSNLGTSKTAVKTLDPIKSKLKAKSNNEVTIKKGPLKAVIPLGNMQKRTSISQRLSKTGAITPPKQNCTSKTTLPSSTPNSSLACRSAPSKPKATSTPNGDEDSKAQRSKIQQNIKKSLTLPVSPSSSLRKNADSKKRLGRTLSPQKRPVTPKKDLSIGADSRIPKTIKSPQCANLSTKIMDKTNRHSSVLSPLKNSNKLAKKINPSNLISKVRKSTSFQMGAEKENYL